MKLDTDLIRHDDNGIFPLSEETPEAYESRAQLIYKGAHQDKSAYEEAIYPKKEVYLPLEYPSKSLQNSMRKAQENMRRQFHVNLDWIPVFHAAVRDILFGFAGEMCINRVLINGQLDCIEPFILISDFNIFGNKAVLEHEYIHMVRYLMQRYRGNHDFEEMIANMTNFLYKPFVFLQMGRTRSNFKKLFGTYADNMLLRFPKEFIDMAQQRSFRPESAKRSICEQAENGDLGFQMVKYRAGW